MVGSIGGFNPAAFAATTGLTRNKPAAADTGAADTVTTPTAKDTFLAYMKETPAQRMVDSWLKAHGLDQKKLDAMKPEDRDAVMKQMKDDIEQQLKTQTEQKAQKAQMVDITV